MECHLRSWPPADGRLQLAHTYGSEGWGFESLRATPPSASLRTRNRSHRSGPLLPGVSVARDRYAEALPGMCVPGDNGAARTTRYALTESRNLLPCAAGLITAARWCGNPPRR